MQQQINEWLKALTEKSETPSPNRTVKYVLEPGHKYTRVVREESWNNSRIKESWHNGKIEESWDNNSAQVSRSVHAFIDNVNGDIYKAAGWKAPAKNGARFNVVNDIETLLRVCDPHGSYLYKNRNF